MSDVAKQRHLADFRAGLAVGVRLLAAALVALAARAVFGEGVEADDFAGAALVDSLARVGRTGLAGDFGGAALAVRGAVTCAAVPEEPEAAAAISSSS